VLKVLRLSIPVASSRPLTPQEALLSYSVEKWRPHNDSQTALRVAPEVFASMTVVAVHGQQGRWATADNATAKFMVDAERQWAEAACTHNKIAEKILADDFQGTSPEAKRYTKSEEVADTADPSKTSRDCRLIDAKVRFFGDDLAIVYGSESSVPKKKDETEGSRCLIWTDTWLKRNGNWQIIAAQDTQFECR
jgi:hypothetical protein